MSRRFGFDGRLFSGSVRGGTLVIGDNLIVRKVISCDSRVTFINNKGETEIITAPWDKDWDQEVRYPKSFIYEDYVIVLAGSFDEAIEIIIILEKAAKKRRKDNEIVDMDFLSSRLMEEMDDFCVRKGIHVMSSVRFMMVALDSEKNLQMKLFGFRIGQTVSEKGNIPKFRCEGASPEARGIAKKLLNEVWESRKLPLEFVDMFRPHHQAMLAAADEDVSIGGNHRMITVWVENGVFRTRFQDLLIGRGYHRVRRTQKSEAVDV